MAKRKNCMALEFRVDIFGREGQLDRIVIRERISDGRKFVRVQRELSKADLAYLRLFGKALNNAAKDLSQRFDAEEVMKKVNPPRPLQRGSQKKPDGPGSGGDDEAEWE